MQREQKLEPDFPSLHSHNQLILQVSSSSFRSGEILPIYLDFVFGDSGVCGAHRR